jgi:hypothetical protein
VVTCAVVTVDASSGAELQEWNRPQTAGFRLTANVVRHEVIVITADEYEARSIRQPGKPGRVWRIVFAIFTRLDVATELSSAQQPGSTAT